MNNETFAKASQLLEEISILTHQMGSIFIPTNCKISDSCRILVEETINSNLRGQIDILKKEFNEL